MPRFRILLLVVPLVAAALAAGPLGDSAPRAQTSANPLAGLRFYVQQDSPSYQQWQAYRRAGQTRKADLIWKIAREPRALWLGRFTRPNFRVKVRRLIDPARAEGTVPIFTVLRAQATSCGPGYTGGGPAEDARTRAWYDDLAAAIGNDRVVIAFEPDSLGTIDCLARSSRDDRLRLLRYGVTALSKLPNATIYLEAGASDWEAASRTAKQLRAIGIAKVQGFLLNATHYDWTKANTQHGLDISRACRRQALHHQHGRERSRPGALQERRTAHQRLVQPRSPRARAGSDHQHLAPEGRRLPLDQPAGLRAVLPGSPDRLVSAARADLRALRHQLGEAAARRALRASQALPAQRVRDSVAG